MGDALVQFRDSLALAEALIKLERDHYTPVPRLADQPFVRGLRGGASVLMVAAFEFYLRRLFQDGISGLNTLPPTIDFHKLPDALKVKAVFHGMQRALNGPAFGEKKDKIDRIPSVVSAAKFLVVEQVDPETFAETNSNPNGETVKLKFKEIGLSNIFGVIKPKFETKWGAVVADTFIKDKLNEIVRQRNVVAHTADTLNITRKNQKEAVKFLKILAELLEKEFDNHLKDVKKSAVKTT